MVAELAACGDAVVAGDELVPAVGVADDQRDEEAAQRDRLRECVDVRGVEIADVLADVDVVEGEAKLAVVEGGGGHGSHVVAPRLSGLLFANANCLPQGQGAERLSKGRASDPPNSSGFLAVPAVGGIRNWLTADGAACQGTGRRWPVPVPGPPGRRVRRGGVAHRLLSGPSVHAQGAARPCSSSWHRASMTCVSLRPVL